MTRSAESEAAIAVVRRNTEEVHGKGNFAVFDELFSDDFLDNTPHPNMVPDKGPDRAGSETRVRHPSLDDSSTPIKIE